MQWDTTHPEAQTVPLNGPATAILPNTTKVNVSWLPCSSKQHTSFSSFHRPLPLIEWQNDEPFFCCLFKHTSYSKPRLNRAVLSLRRVRLAHSRISSPDKFICHWNSSAYFPKQTVSCRVLFSMLTRKLVTPQAPLVRFLLFPYTPVWEREAVGVACCAWRQRTENTCRESDS